MTSEDTLGLADLLERQTAYLLSRDESGMLLGLPAFLAFIEREPRLAGLLRDLSDESNEAWEAYERQCLLIWAEMGALWEGCRATVENDWDPDSSTWSDLEINPVQFSELLAVPPTLGRNEGSQPPTVIDEPLGLLADLLARASDETQGARRTQIRYLQERLTQEWRTRKLGLVSEGGAAYVKLRHWAGVLLHRPNEQPGESPDAQELESNEFWGRIESRSHFDDCPEAQLALPSLPNVAQAAELLVHALQTKIALGRSRIAMVRRYAGRCQTFDRLRLDQLINSEEAKGRVEQLLTVDFARFLFDAGFNPIVDPTIGGLRPDLLDPSLTPAFYVEAKQYRTTISLTKIRENVAQVVDTWGRLRPQYELPEAFLLVFRLGGPLVVLPPRVRVSGRDLWLQVVDLAPASASGSRTKSAPVILTEEDLLPAAD